MSAYLGNSTATLVARRMMPPFPLWDDETIRSMTAFSDESFNRWIDHGCDARFTAQVIKRVRYKEANSSPQTFPQFGFTSSPLRYLFCRSQNFPVKYSSHFYDLLITRISSMDAFTSFAALFTPYQADEVSETGLPTDQERTGGAGGNCYCVIAWVPSSVSCILNQRAVARLMFTCS